jgi:serine/threonine protein kinase
MFGNEYQKQYLLILFGYQRRHINHLAKSPHLYIICILIWCRYIVKDLLGHGTFGQVAKCWDSDTNSFVAVKIIKNQPAYYQQALVEVTILTTVTSFCYYLYCHF